MYTLSESVLRDNLNHCPNFQYKNTLNHLKVKRSSRSGGMLPINWRSLPTLDFYQSKYQCNFSRSSSCCSYDDRDD